MQSSRFIVVLAISILLLASTHKGVAQKDKAILPLKTLVNSKGYVLASPAQSWAFQEDSLLLEKAQQPL